MAIQSLFSDPVGYLISLLLSLPGILLALCGHEMAHAWVADRCGDPTARLMGRVTLNPARHLDPIGFISMLVVGLGWARPVPVNPLNYRHYRRDDLKVSLAGITANLIMCLIGFLIVMLIVSVALSALPSYDANLYANVPEENTFFLRDGEEVILVNWEETMLLNMEDIFKLSSGYWSFGNSRGQYYGIEELVIRPALGQAGAYAYEMARIFMMVNLSLAVFNLIPLPPLDGYHVLNDLILKRPLFAPATAQRVGSTILLILIMAGNYSEKFDIISQVLRFVQRNVFDGLTTAAYHIAHFLTLV